MTRPICGGLLAAPECFHYRAEEGASLLLLTEEDPKIVQERKAAESYC